MYADDNTEKRRSLDVARIMILTSSSESLNQNVKVCINNECFVINMVEDWSGPLQWRIENTQKPKVEESSSFDESFLMIIFPATVLRWKTWRRTLMMRHH